MNKIAILLFLLISSNINSQNLSEKEIKTEVKEVTVFINGAQITRTKSIDITKGISILKFTNLSPFIDAKSIQVKAKGDVTVLAVNQQQNFIDKSKKSQELIRLEDKRQEYYEKIKLEKTYISINKEEQSFLNINRNITGNNQSLNINTLKEASTFYGSKLTALKLKAIERNKNLRNLEIQKQDIEQQIKTITSKKDFPSGEILVKIDAKVNSKINFDISYLVANAGWFPKYDIRVKNISQPVNLIYKATVKQDTKVNWKNIKLKLSSANPNISGIAPELQTYYLDYNSAPPSYKENINNVSGRVFDPEGLPLPGVNIIVEGTTIGTSTDFDGKYSISIPNNAQNLKFAFVGYKTKTSSINSKNIIVYLEEDQNTLDEVVVTAYSKGLIDYSPLQGKTSGVKIRGASSINKKENSTIPVVQKENQTSIDFEIKIPYTINSTNKEFSVEMDSYELSAKYIYFSVPKIEKNVYLIANIVDWEKYNLLEGEANIFFEDTFIGKSLLDVRYATDTLQISLGRDKNVSIKREKIKNYTSKKLIGKNKKETIGWNIIIKNNKSQEISMIVLDQVPISTLDEIEIEIIKTSNAKLNSDTGEVKWKFKLASKNQKEIELKYSVKYPKYKNLIIE